MQLRIEKMECGGCAKAISNTIRAIDSNAQIDIDLTTKRVDVIANADQNMLLQKLAEAGYPAEQVA